MMNIDSEWMEINNCYLISRDDLRFQAIWDQPGNSEGSIPRLRAKVLLTVSSQGRPKKETLSFKPKFQIETVSASPFLRPVKLFL